MGDLRGRKKVVVGTTRRESQTLQQYESLILSIISLRGLNHPDIADAPLGSQASQASAQRSSLGANENNFASFA